MTRLESIRADFLDRMSLIAAADGMPPISGRMFALLVFDGGPISFGDLAERLNVSRGSVSNSVRFLESRGVLRRFTRPGERGEYFDLAEDPYSGLMERIARRARDAETEISITLEQLGKTLDDRYARLSELSLFYGAVYDSAAATLTRLTGENDDRTP
ncbi:MAG: transcriptional regulator [Rhodobacterales bacterium]|nr:MAG: transcriptional regulator [Rhodobacterales bacterium]